MTVMEEEGMVIPVTTPGSFFDEEKCLVSFYVGAKVKEKKMEWRKQLPVALLGVSLLETISFLVCNDHLQKALRFEPSKLHQVWRFLTYMLLHSDWLHLVLNVFMQVLFAYFLELRQGHLRILALYLGGGVSGALGASCVHPDLVVGASGGVYALLIAHVADLLMNFEGIKYKLNRCICIVIIIISDVAYNVVHALSEDEPLISWGAHVVGGATGLCLGLVLFKGEAPKGETRKWRLFYGGLSLYIILMISLVIMLWQIKRCTPLVIIRTRYIYFC